MDGRPLIFTSPNRTRVLPEFGIFKWPKSDKSDFGWGEVDDPRASERIVG